jgi:hypothetical protein
VFKKVLERLKKANAGSEKQKVSSEAEAWRRTEKLIKKQDLPSSNGRE